MPASLAVALAGAPACRVPSPLLDPGTRGQQMAHGRWMEAGFRWDDLVRARVGVGGEIQVYQPLLPQLHYRDRREGLGEGRDLEDGVLSDPGV